MKALILSGGKGKRLRPLTNTVAKQLLPIANKPILYYVIEQIVNARISDIGIIISPETGQHIRETVGDGSRWNAQITYILQSEPLGLAHAVKTAQNFLGSSPFLMFLGDNLLQEKVRVFVEEFDDNKLDSLILLKEVATPHNFGVAELDASGYIIHLVERPKEPASNLAVVGVYLFTPEVHRAIAKIKPSWRGELEITDAIERLLHMKKTVRSHILKGWWLDTGEKNDLLEANRAVLDEFVRRDIRGQVDGTSQVVGRVEVREGANIENSIIRGPVSIAENCQIKDSFIGPFASIGSSTKVEFSCVEYSVILEGCVISNIERLEESVIGRGTEITQQGNIPKATRLFVGDDTRVEL